MTAEQLRNSLLQEAISGRLVPQDPNDEPASALLDKFEARRAELIAEKKIKPKDNVPLPIKEDDIPYELPTGWSWCRIAQYTQKVTDFVASGSFASLRENVKYYDTPNYAVLVRTKDFRANFSKDLVYTDKHGYEFLENSRLFGGEMILPNIGASIGKVFIVPELPFRMTLAPNSVMTRFFFDYQREWLYYFFLSPFGQETLSSISSATAQGKFNKTEFKQILFPLPPLAEQQRIVAKLEELLPIVEQYGKAQTELNELNAALPSRLRQSILQQAIQGNLTEHDLDDTWADDYVTKLPKLKYKSSPEWPQDYPFEIPNNWRWCRIGDICELLNGYAFKSNQYKDTGVRVIRITNVQNGYIVDNNPKFYPSIPDIEKYALKEGDLLMSLTGNVGRVGLLPKEMLPAALNQRVACLRLKDERLRPYLFWYLRCAVFRERCEDSGHGMAQLNISTEWVKQEYFPLPPLAEQLRIVAKIEELFAEIDKLSK